MATSLASYEAIWLCKLITGLFGQKLEQTMIHYDNQSCIKILENPLFHDKSKHIELKYHSIKDKALKRAVKFQYISPEEQLTDIFTKPLVKGMFV